MSTVKAVSVSLTRAHKVEQRIGEQITELTRKLNAEQAPVTKLDDFAVEPNMALIDEIEILMRVQQNVRNALGQANHESGINTLLGELALVNRMLVFHGRTQNLFESSVGEVVEQDYNQNRVKLFIRSSAPDMSSRIRALKVRKTRLSDNLAEANQTQVTLEIPVDLLDLVLGSV